MLLIGLSFIGCEKEQSVETMSDSQFQEVYQMSEMAVLMESYYTQLESIRQKVMDNEDIGGYPISFSKIYRAEMTPTFERNEEFKQRADLFLKETELLYKSSNKSKIELYNNAVNSCIECHKSDVGCIGPVKRIQKLQIKDF